MTAAKRHARTSLFAASLLFVLAGTTTTLAESGSVAGKVRQLDGTGIPAVLVSVAGTKTDELTLEDGSYELRHVPVGVHTIVFSLGDRSIEKSGVRVSGNETTTLDVECDWPVGPLETVTVHGASRRRERLVSSPAAVTVVPAENLVENASASLLPRTLEFTPGVEVARGGLNWIVVNARGFANGLNNRVLALVDGRDLSLVILRTPDWGSNPYPGDALRTVEFVRGPNSALYGAEAFNGVISVTTEPPEERPGGSARVTVGEWETTKLDLRYAVDLGKGWFIGLAATYTKDDPFSVSRTETVEYSRPCEQLGDKDCLPLEAVPVVEDALEQRGGVLRLDKEFDAGGLLTVEAGSSRYTDTDAVLTGSTRYQVLESTRPFFRVNYNAPNWNLLAYQDGRKATMVPLGSGQLSFVDERRRHAEAQGHVRFGGGRGLLVGGAAYRDERVDTANPEGVQTLQRAAETQTTASLFGQVEWPFGERIVGVLAARWDDSSLQEGRLSPRATIMVSLTPTQTLRVGYSNAYRLPNYSDYFLWVPIAPPVDLSPFEAFCAPFGVDCGFDQPVPVLVSGNESLDVEQTRSFEVGYRAVLGPKVYLTADLYRSWIEDFITDAIPLVEPGLGRINPNLPPYRPPSALPDAAATALLAALEAALPPQLYAVMSKDPDGLPVFVPYSVTNYGDVDTWGAELGLIYRPAPEWMLEATYTWLDFEVQDELPSNPLLPNTASQKFGAGVSYASPRFGASLKYRHVEGFEWRTGPYWGYVPAHDVVNLAAAVRLNRLWEIGLDVENLFDEVHIEQFGGDLLHRRAMVYVKLGW